MDIRSIVNERLAVLGWNTARLIKEVRGKIPPTTVYEFVRGESSIRSDALGIIFEALGLDVVARDKRKGR